MTEKELNRDIKRLNQILLNRPKNETVGEYCDFVENIAKKYEDDYSRIRENYYKNNLKN